MEAIDIVCDLIAWLIGRFLSPILEDNEDVEKQKQQKKKKEEDDWYRGRYERPLQRQFQAEKEDDSGAVRIYRYGPKTHDARQGFESAFGNP